MGAFLHQFYSSKKNSKKGTQQKTKKRKELVIRKFKSSLFKHDSGEVLGSENSLIFCICWGESSFRGIPCCFLGFWFMFPNTKLFIFLKFHFKFLRCLEFLCRFFLEFKNFIYNLRFYLFFFFLFDFLFLFTSFFFF